MADEPEDDVEEGEGKEKAAGGSKKKLIIIISASVFVVVLGVVGGIMAMGGGDDTTVQAEATEGGAEGKATGETAAAPAPEVKQALNKGKAVFYTIRPPFVVNFQNASSAKYLQLSVDIMARNNEVINAVEENLPIIKNDLILLFSSQTYEELRTMEGREELRKSAIQTIQAVLARESGLSGVEDVLFTTFVMQ